MTHPFQSIVGTAPNGGLAAHVDDHNRHAPRIEAYDTSEQSTNAEHVETGLTELHSLRSPLSGGYYSPDEALAVFNSHFFVGKSNQDTAIFRINVDGTVTFLPHDQFKLEVQNIFVVKGTAKEPKLVPADKFWKEHPKRNQKKLVFKPGGTSDVSEYNLWRGFGVEPHMGWEKQYRLLQHIREVICRCNHKKFKYLMRALAWMVQHPDKHSGVVIVLKSRKQGTGKTTLGNVMLDIFGEHGARIDDKDRLLGRFTDWLETKSFVLAEEILFAGDPKSNDKLKSLVTGDTIQVEQKYRSCRQIPNRLKIIATTNHDHAVAAGVRDRRNVVYDVSDEHVGDKPWFNALYQDLADGGTCEFLWLLQSIRLGNWHPSRDLLKTSETTEQQRMSGDSVSQWSQACIEADAVIGAGRGPHGSDTTHDLNAAIATKELQEAYTGFCRQHGLRPASTDAFGKACTEMFGRRKRLSAKQNSQRRPWGYDVPDGIKWQEAVDARLGIES